MRAAARRPPLPDGPFTLRQLLYRDFDDQRTCNCGQVEGACEGVLATFDPAELRDPYQECVTNHRASSQQIVGACGGPLDASYVSFDLLDEGVSCSIAGTDALTGEVFPTEPVTVCCEP